MRNEWWNDVENGMDDEKNEIERTKEVNRDVTEEKWMNTCRSTYERTADLQQ